MSNVKLKGLENYEIGTKRNAIESFKNSLEHYNYVEPFLYYIKGKDRILGGFCMIIIIMKNVCCEQLELNKIHRKFNISLIRVM